MYALNHTTMFVHIPCGSYTAAKAALEEVIALADEKGALFWKALGTMNQACVLTLTGKASDAIQMFTSGIAAYRSTGATIWRPLHLSYLARANAELGLFDDAWRYIGEAMMAIEISNERWFEAEVHRIAGQITLLSQEPEHGESGSVFRARAVRLRVSNRQNPGNCGRR